MAPFLTHMEFQCVQNACLEDASIKNEKGTSEILETQEKVLAFVHNVFLFLILEYMW